MIKKKFLHILKLSLITLPLAIVIFLFLNILMSAAPGGVVQVAGLPFNYLVDYWDTPQVDYYDPFIILVDILIFYIILTAIAYSIKKT